MRLLLPKRTLSLALLGAAAVAGGRLPGLNGASLILSNDQLEATWEIRGDSLRLEQILDRQTSRIFAPRGEWFALALTNGEVIQGATFKLAGAPRAESLPGDSGAARLAERLPGNELTAQLEEPGGNLHLEWHGILRDGSRYLRQEFIFRAVRQGIGLKEIVLLDTPLADARATGVVDGVPVAAQGDTVYLGVEHPLSINRAEAGRARCFLPGGAELRAGESYGCWLVIGLAAKGQLRRDFLEYLERERAHPYRPFLHYNSWYDIGNFNKYDEKEALGAMEAIGTELVVRRGVKVDCFLFDDGWDDNATLWRFHSGFPHGFAPIEAAAARYGSAPGIWLSPWGGYGKPHEQRLQYGKEQGYEIREGNFSLAGPKYYQRFRSLCVSVVTNYGINQFKFDGIGQNTGRGGGGAMGDFDAMLRLIGELRALKPDLYINQTTGTWPSPFWLFYADSIWRGGDDYSFVSGPEPERQRWISYRDNEVYERVAGRSRLYPLNSLMLCGIIYARLAKGLNYDTDDGFKSEVRSFFGSGTQLQELYISPSLMTPQNWDTLAEAAKWSRENAATLVDVHWVGGAPAQGQVYGWAAWSARKGILTLRNPAPKAQPIEIDAGQAFELPARAPQDYTLVSPFKDQLLGVKQLKAGQAATFRLAPFEVLVVEAMPSR